MKIASESGPGVIGERRDDAQEEKKRQHHAALTRLQAVAVSWIIGVLAAQQ